MKQFEVRYEDALGDDRKETIKAENLEAAKEAASRDIRYKRAYSVKEVR